MNAPNYLNPDIPEGLNRVTLPIVAATGESLQGYGALVDDPADFEIEIVRWPAQGWRTIDEDTGREGGTTEGTFVSEWKGDVIYGNNSAVDGHYVLGYATEPNEAREDHARRPANLLLWHANYHPDGGQLFFPNVVRPFVVPLALPGDDVRPSDFVCFWFGGDKGLYIHPSIWHEGVFATEGRQGFFDKQGAVHARVSVDFPKEFQCLLHVPLTGSG